MATRSVPPPGRPVGDPPFEPHRIEVAGAELENVRRPATRGIAAGDGLALVAVPMALSRDGEAAG